MRKITFNMDDDLADAVAAYGGTAGHSCLGETYRALVADGLLQHTERPYASLVQAAVRRELEAFAADLDRRLAYTGEDLAEEIRSSLEGSMSYACSCASAALEGAAMASGAEDAGAFVDEALRRAAARGAL